MALYIIGGNEDKEGSCTVLRRFVEAAGGEEAVLAVIPAASGDPAGAGEEYRRVFTRLGAARVEVVTFTSRREAAGADLVNILESSTGIFLTGGDQLRLTALLGGTELDRALHRAYRRGAVVGGTSAGAAAMGTTMIVEGPGEEAPRAEVVRMAPGLGLIREVMVDQHFAQRGRLGRLLAAVAHNPYILGLGIDEDTAVLVDDRQRFMVYGSGAVTVVDGREIDHSSISDAGTRPVALTGCRLHVLAASYGFDLALRRPLLPEV
ncbi:MAG: cyanophycinase [Thermoanaerobacteraceae bacterium]|nr:cyanophycinase [Thermoanaerobacteraceae bacterium]